MAWAGITTILTAMLMVAPVQPSVTEAQANTFGVTSAIGEYQVDTFTTESASPIETLFVITMGDNEGGQTLDQIDLGFGSEAGTSAWTNAGATSTVLADLDGYSNMSGIVLYKDSDTFGMSGLIDPWDDTLIALDNPQYSANTLALTPLIPETITAGDVYMIGFQTDSTGITDGDAWSTSFQANGVTTSGLSPTNEAVNAAIITISEADGWGDATAELISAKALDGDFNSGSRLELIFSSSLNDITWNGVTSNEIDWYVWARDTSWNYRDAGSTAAFSAIGTTNVSNDTLVLTFGTGANFTNGDILEFNVPLEDWSWVWGETTLDLTGPTLDAVLFDDGYGDDGVFTYIGDCATFVFSEAIDQTTINAASFHTSIPNSDTTQFPPVMLEWTAPNMVEVCLSNTVLDVVGANFNPAATVTDLAGNADATIGLGPAMAAGASLDSATGISLTDSDTTGWGVDASDISVSWDTYTDVECDHINVYLLPDNVPLQLDTHYPMNDSGMSCDASTFEAASDVSGYFLWEDSRANYAGDYGARTQWYDLDSTTNYVVYVVASSETYGSEDLSNTAISQSNPTQFTGEWSGGGTDDWDMEPYMWNYTPAWGSTVPTNTRNLSITWSEEMDAASAAATANFNVQYDSDADGTADTELSINSISYDSETWTSNILLGEDLPSTANTLVQVNALSSITDNMGTAMYGNDYFYFYASGANDTTNPTISYSDVTDGETGTSTFNEIRLSFSEPMDATTIDVNSVSFSPMVAGHEVTYDSWGDQVEIRFTTPMVANTSYTLTLAGTITDLAGNELTQTTYDFTTGNADTTSASVTGGWADEWGIVTMFSMAMNESTVTNPDNVSIINDATGAPINLSGANMWYDNEWNELHIDGLDVTEGVSYSLEFTANVKGANGNAIDQQGGNNALAFDIVGMNDFGFDNMSMTEGDTYDFGYMDDEMGAYTTDFMMFSPAWVWPRNSMAGQTATYDFGFPTNGVLDDGSSVTVQFPSGFDLSGTITMNTTDFWGSSDLNGGGDGVVTASAITADNVDKTITIDLSVLDSTGLVASQTSSNDYLDFSLDGIVNTSTASAVDWSAYPATGGYSLYFDARNSSNVPVVDNLESERFEIVEAGSGSISGTLLDSNGDPVEGATVYADNWAVGMISDVTAADGTYSISGLPTSDAGCATCSMYYWLWIDAPAGYIDNNNWNEVTLTDALPTSASNTLYVSAADCVISGSISHTGTTGDVRVMASGPGAWVEEQVTLSGNSTDYTLNLSEGTYDVGVEPWFWNPGQQTFAPPPRTQVSCTSATSPVDNDITIAQASFTITGTVTDQNGNGLGDVHVDAWNNNSWGGGGGAFADTAADGSYTLYVSEGNYSVNIWKEGLGWVPEQSVFLDGNNTSVTSNFTIKKPSSTVSGTVTDDAGNPLSWASVEAYPATGGFYNHAWTQTDSDGNFSMYMDAGTWNFEVWAYPYGKVPAATGVDITAVVIADGTDYTGIDFQYDESAFNTISGQVLDSEGAGVANTMIWCDEINSTTGMFTSNFNSSSSDSEGNYSIRLPKNTNGVTEYVCRANSWEKGDSDPLTGIDVSSGSLTSKNITFGSQSEVTVSITGAPTDLSWAWVDVWDPTSFRGNGTDLNLSSGSGSNTMYLGDGTYEVHTWIDGFGDFDATLTVAGEDTSVTIDLAAYLANSITVSGTVTSGGVGVPYAWVDAFNKNNGKVRGTNTDSSGVYSLMVGEGTWEVRADAPNYVSGTPTSISETGTVNLILDSADSSISGTVYQSDGVTAASGGFVWAESADGSFATAPVNGDGTYNLGVSSSDTSTWTVNAGDMGYEGNTTAAAGTSDADVTADTAMGWWDATIEPATATFDPDDGGVLTDTGSTGTGIAISFDPGDLGTGDPANLTAQPAVVPTTANKSSFKAVDITVVQGEQTISDLSTSVDLDIILDQDNINSLIDEGEITVNRFRNDLENAVVNSWSSDNNDFVAADATTIQVEVDGTAMDADTFWPLIEADNDYCGGTATTCEITYDSGTQHLTIFGLVTASDSTPPSAPSGLAATAGDGSVTLAWTANSESDLLEYEVYRGTSSSVDLIAANQLNSTQLTTNAYSDTTAVNGTTYYYVVTAVDTSGNESSAPTAVEASPAAAGDDDDDSAVVIGGGGGGTIIAEDLTHFSDDEETTEEETTEETTEEEVTTTEEVVTTGDDDVEVTTTGDDDVEVTLVATTADYLDHWAQSYIVTVMDLGIAEGIDEDRFDPDTEITRAQLAKMVVNAVGYDVPDEVDEKPFWDVHVDGWYAPYAEVAQEEGLMEGYSDGSFQPNTKVNRAEALKVLVEGVLGEDILIDPSQGLLGSFNLDENPFSDVDLDEWYAVHVLYAYMNGIVSGYGDGTFGPDNSMTRAEFSKVIVVAMELE